MLRNLIFPSLATMALAACSANANSPQFTVTLPVPGTPDGATVYLMDFDKDIKVDSTSVANSTVKFTTEIESPFIARLVIGGNRGPLFFAQQGDITFEGSTPQGTPLNDALKAYAQAYN